MAAAVPSPDNDQLLQMTQQRVAAAEKAIDTGDLKELGKIIYEHKMGEVKITHHTTELSKKLESLV